MCRLQPKPHPFTQQEAAEVTTKIYTINTLVVDNYKDVEDTYHQIFEELTHLTFNFSMLMLS